MALFRCGMGGGNDFGMIPTVLAQVNASKQNTNIPVYLNDSVDNYKAIAIIEDGNRGVFSRYGNGYITFPTNTGAGPSCMAIMSTDYLKTLSNYIDIICSATLGYYSAILKLKYVNKTTINLYAVESYNENFKYTKIIGLN